MGTEFYIADLTAKRVLDIHKSYWIGDAAGATTLPAILRAFDGGNPGWRCHQPRVRIAVETWVTRFSTGPLVVLKDSIDDMPFVDDRGYLLDSWEGWAVFGTWPDPSGWKPWMGYPPIAEVSGV